MENAGGEAAHANDNDRRLGIVLIHQAVTPVVLPVLRSWHKVVGIVESSSKPRPHAFLELAGRAGAMIDPRFATLKALTHAHGIPYFFLTNRSENELAAWVKNLSPDVIAIHTMSRLLKPEVFSIPRYGAINLHQSYLPAYRGPNPDFWQYHDMETNQGVTTHFIDEGEDTGDIIFQQRVAIPLGTKMPERMQKLVGEAGVALFLKTLDALADGSAPRFPQPQASPTPRARKISADEYQRIVDWNTWTIERIWNFLRGIEHWPSAIDEPGGLYKGQRWRIEEFVKCDMPAYRVSQVYAEGGRHVVACRDGKIYLRKTFQVKRCIARLMRK